MADISDVTKYIAQQVANTIYPESEGNAFYVTMLPILFSGFGGMGGMIPAPSIAPVAPGQTTPMDVLIYEGWPVPELLWLDVGGQMQSTTSPQTAPVARPGGPRAHVSIFPLQGSSRSPFQIQDNTYVQVAPVLGVTVTVDDDQITLSGTPNPGEIVTIEGDRQFIFSSNRPTLSGILSDLLAQAKLSYLNASLFGDTLTIPYDYSLVVRQGGVGTLAKVVHRQCQAVMVSVWAPDHNTRSVLASAIDVALKSNIVVTLPDTSQAKIVYQRTNISDEQENVTIYRRDLIYEVEFATLETFPGTTITSVSFSFSAYEYSLPVPPANIEFIS